MRKDLKLLDVMNEYNKKATPGKGKMEFEEGFIKENHMNEVNTAKWLLDTYGGDIKVLKESSKVGIKTPDYIWRGKYWELKNTTTEKAANSALRSGIKQIQKNPGGIILDYKENSFSLKNLEEIMNKRLAASADFNIDIIIIKCNKVISVLRYIK